MYANCRFHVTQISFTGSYCVAYVAYLTCLTKNCLFHMTLIEINVNSTSLNHLQMSLTELSISHGSCGIIIFKFLIHIEFSLSHKRCFTRLLSIELCFSHDTLGLELSEVEVIDIVTSIADSLAYLLTDSSRN